MSNKNSLERHLCPCCERSRPGEEYISGSPRKFSTCTRCRTIWRLLGYSRDSVPKKGYSVIRRYRYDPDSQTLVSRQCPNCDEWRDLTMFAGAHAKWYCRACMEPEGNLLGPEGRANREAQERSQWLQKGFAPVPIDWMKGYVLAGPDGSLVNLGRFNLSHGSWVWKPTCHPLRTSQTNAGYRCICINVEGVRCTYNVHYLVYTAFKGVVPEGCEILHIDQDKQNNAIDNLRVGTRQQNLAEAVEHQGEWRNWEVVYQNGRRGSKLSGDDVLAILTKRSKGVPVSRLADEFKVTQPTIYNICNGTTWTSIHEAFHARQHQEAA